MHYKERVRMLLSSIGSKQWVRSISKHTDLIKEVEIEYPDYPLIAALNLIVNDLEKPVAPCGRVPKYQNGKFSPYCTHGVKPTKDKPDYCVPCNLAWRAAKLEATKANCLEKHGVEHHFQREDVKTKIVETTIERFGVAYNQLNEEVRAKTKKTLMDKYGVECALQAEEVKAKIKETNIEKFGVENVSSSSEIQELKRKNHLEKYGVNSPQQRPEVRAKTEQTNLERYGDTTPVTNPDVIAKIKATNMERYGVESPLLNDEIKEKIEYTMLERYGVKRPLQSEEILSKMYENNIEKYGSIFPMQNEEVKVRSQNAILEKYGTTSVYSSEKRNEYMDSLTKIRYSRLSEKYPQYQLLFNYDFMLGKNHTYKYPFKCNLTGCEFASAYNNPVKCDCCHIKEPNISEQENTLLSYIKELIPEYEVLQSVRILDKKEIDIFIPDLNIGFEYNGMYWHNSDKKEPYYHQDKTILAKEMGIELIHIFEDEWLYKTEIVKARIKSKLKLSSKVPARKCIVREIDSNTTNDFLNEHHIQGTTNASIKYGLYYNETLVAVMTFSRSRFDKNCQYELVRYCSIGTVQGGASKLLKHFERTHNPESLMSYADMNWSCGNLYEQLGFEYTGYTEPSYFYYNNTTKERISRQKCMKHKLVEQGYDENLTETQICTEILKYFKLYDAGNLKYYKYYNNVSSNKENQ